MNQSLSPISDPRNESTEVSRRLYRSMMETTRQLDDLRSHAKATKDLFSVQAHLLRTKLREYAERLLFSSSLIPSQKIEEILWRKGFYEDVSTSKRLRKDNQWMPEERAQLIIHLKCGVGFYHHLLLCLQAVFGISSGCIDFCLVCPDQEYAKSKMQLSTKQLETARDSVHRCLVCLGDLSRYLMDIPPCWDEQMAYRYYHQALSWNPDIGKPHNQLGTLSLSINCNLDAVYHFMRCLVSSQPFEGAEGNLKRSFERNSQHVPQEKALSSGSTLWRCHCLEPGLGQLSVSQDNVQQFLAHFLLLADVWFFDKMPVSNISDLCHQTLLDLRRCLGLIETEDLENNPDVSVRLSRPRENFPSKLSKDMVLKIVVITLMCLCKLKSKGSDQSSSIIAFLLAILCLLVQEVLEHFKDSVLNVSIPIVREQSSPVSVVGANGDHNTEEISIPNGTDIVKENGQKESDHSEIKMNGVSNEIVAEKKPKKRKKIVRRRHRQCHSSDDSDQSNDEESNILSVLSDASDDEEVVLDLSSDDDEVPHNGGLIEKANDDADVVILEELCDTADASQSKSFVNGRNEKNVVCGGTSWKIVNPVDVLEQVAGEGLLPAIKVCSDWLQEDNSVVQAVGRDSLEVLKSFVNLVNAINIDTVKLKKDPAAKIFLKNRSIIESECKLPLPEDAQLRKLSGLARAHTDLDWEMILQNSLTSKEEALLRIQRLVLFCHFLETVPETGVKYDNETRIFSICVSGKKCGKDTMSQSSQAVGPRVDLQRREEVMHNMGQLWLRAEVQTLETSVKRGSNGASFSPYLVLDVHALTKYYHIVGQLMMSRKFIMIVPSVVLTALDQLKRESVLARDAIRWLEFQLQKGSRFLRVQTASEILHLPLVSYPKQKSREAWVYFKVLECCHYLNHHNMSRNKDSDAGLVTLLTGQSWADSNEFSPVGVAKAVGIAVEHIESFFAKWKTSSKSHG